MDKIETKSPAKINFGLKIISKRQDGFHNLETVFYPLKLSDKLIFEKSDNFVFKSNSSILDKEKSNLIIKAKEILENEVKQKLNCKIFLEKNIPIGAGLGGGSSNAATTLISLNKLFDLHISQAKLIELGLCLGSDVPFFINPVTSFACSRGEILQKIEFDLTGYILLVNPNIHISTKWAFGKLTKYSVKDSLKDALVNITSETEFYRSIDNDFEEIVFGEYPEIKNIKENLYDLGAYFASMSGTGSTVYGFFSDENEAEYAKEKFSKNYFIHLEKLNNEIK